MSYHLLLQSLCQRLSQVCFCDKIICSTYGLNHTHYELNLLLIQGHRLLLELGLGHHLKLRRASLLEKEEGHHYTIKMIIYLRSEKTGVGLGEN